MGVVVKFFARASRASTRKPPQTILATPLRSLLLALVCSLLTFKLSLGVKMCLLAYLLAMGSHFALHCYHAMMRGVDKAINSLLRKFLMCLCRQLLNSAATTRTQCYQIPFSCAFRGWVMRLCGHYYH